MEITTDKQAVLRYLSQKGSITPSQAWRNLGVYRLAARIYELRKDGHTIETLRSGRRTIYRYVS